MVFGISIAPLFRTALSILTAAVLLWGSGMVVPLNLCLCPSEGLAVESALDLCCPGPVDGAGDDACPESLGVTPADCGDCTDIPVQPTWARGSASPTGKEIAPAAEAPPGPFVSKGPHSGLELISACGADPPDHSRSRLIVLRC